MKRKFLLPALILIICISLVIVPASAVFTDVEAGDWYAQAVTEMSNSGLLEGYPDGSFRPDKTITAAEFVTITARCVGLVPVAGQSGHWASGMMQAAMDAGWYDWDELPPSGEQFDHPISRQLAVKILMRALLPDIRGDYNTESSKIRDFSSLNGRYYEPVLAAYAAGIIIGDNDGNFRPLSGLTRAEACAIFCRALALIDGKTPSLPEPVTPPATFISGGVAENGQLQVIGTQLCNDAGQAIVLRGMSSHGIHWYGQFATTQAMRNTADAGANVFRVAMYTGEGGYISQPDTVKQMAIEAVDAAIANDMYVILDWHILSDGNPLTHAAEAEVFFTEMAHRYKDSPAILYEICNEPNGNATWSEHIKPYAQRIVQAIRSEDPDAVILIGSSTWSQDIHLAVADPVKGDNLMYTLHFYAGTHGEPLRKRIDDALDAGLPVFISEWGTSRADGSGGVFLEEAEQWLDFLDARGLSWVNWSLCDKNETSAALQPGTSPYDTWTNDDLTASGRFVFSRFGS